MKKTLWTILLVFLCLTALAAPDIEYRGKVIDAGTGEPLAGASVIVKGTLIGAITDNDGQFVLPVPSEVKNIVFEVSYISYSTLEVKPASRTGLVF